MISDNSATATPVVAIAFDLINAVPLRKIWFLTLLHIWYLLSMRKS
ncbi:hypothetical protein LC612_28910 [Nostoc sp. CHAB 5834]|nr:hypothetical protein [Nostoc sp. CHAB 5834]